MSPTQEFELRLAAEADKAAEKYGADAALEAGHPDKDVHDYAINELVGLVRYGEMIEARMELFDQHANTRLASELRRGIALGRHIAEAGRDLGTRLIAHRQALRAAGLHLGEGEDRS